MEPQTNHYWHYACRVNFGYTVDVKARLLDGKQTEQNQQPKQRVAKKARTQSKNQLEKALRDVNKSSNTNAPVTRNELQEAGYRDMKTRK